MEGQESSSSCSESYSTLSESSASSDSEGTSSLSSCVIIPSSATSQFSEYASGSSSSWLQKYTEAVQQPVQPPAIPTKPCDIGLWVAACEPETSANSWLVPARERQPSVSSVASDISQLQLSGDYKSYDEWRVTSNVSHAKESTQSVEFEDLVASSKGYDGEWLQQSKNEYIPIKLGYSEESWLDFGEEKYDNAAEKDQSDDWLVKKGNHFASAQQEKATAVYSAWLSDEHSTVVARPYACMDKEWLYIVNMMSKIASSNSSEWLQSKINHKEVAKLPMENTCTVNDHSVWLKK